MNKYMTIIALCSILLSNTGCGGKTKEKGNSHSVLIDQKLYFDSLMYDFVEMYVYDKNEKCYKNKNGNLIANGRINPCFIYRSHISKDDFDSLYTILDDTSSYGGIFYSCFSSEIAFAFIRNDTICGTINISFECNQVGSIPQIRGNYYRLNNFLNERGTDVGIGLSKEARIRIISIVRKYYDSLTVSASASF